MKLPAIGPSGFHEYQVSTDSFTILVGIDQQEVVRYAAPIVSNFIGQPLDNLIRWAKSLGGYRLHPIPTVTPEKSHARRQKGTRGKAKRSR